MIFTSNVEPYEFLASGMNRFDNIELSKEATDEAKDTILDVTGNLKDTR